MLYIPFRMYTVKTKYNSENMEQIQLSGATAGNVKWYNHFGKQLGSFSFLKLNIHLALPSHSTSSHVSINRQKHMLLQRLVYEC